MPVAGAIAGGIASSVVSSAMSGGGNTAVGNTAGGAYYDPYAANRGKAASTLDALIYGTGSTSGTPVGTSSSGQTYQQYLAGFQGGGNITPIQFAMNNSGMASYARNAADNGNGATPMSQAQWDQQNPGTTGTAGTSPTDMIKAMPGYQFGMNAGADTLNRTMAATGQSQSGGQQVALSEFGQQYAGSFYDKMVNNLMGMSGATQSPMNVQGQNSMNQGQNNLIGSTLGSSLSAGISGLANTFGGQSSGVSNNMFSSSTPSTDIFSSFNIGGVNG